MGFPNLSMRSGANQVAAGGTQFGWVSGDLGGLAASGSIDIFFDLGPSWAAYSLVQIGHTGVSGSSGVTVATVRSSDDTALDVQDIVLNSAFGTALGQLTGTSSAAGRTGFVRPQGRYLIVSMTNADAVNPVGAGASVRVTAYPQSGM